jgi:hypothetical protein
MPTPFEDLDPFQAAAHLLPFILVFVYRSSLFVHRSRRTIMIPVSANFRTMSRTINCSSVGAKFIYLLLVLFFFAKSLHFLTLTTSLRKAVKPCHIDQRETSCIFLQLFKISPQRSWTIGYRFDRERIPCLKGSAIKKHFFPYRESAASGGGCQ